MAKKRKTLPADFEQLVQESTLTELQLLFDKCDINAYGGYWRGNALTFCGISEEFIRWAVEKGIDMDAQDQWGNLPLMYQAEYNLNNFKLLLELGADIEKRNKYKHTPLCNAVADHLADKGRYIQRIEAFVKNGADVNSMNDNLGKMETPLEMGLRYCVGMYIPAMAEAADLLLEAGARITPTMKDCVQEIGKNFEFHRDNFNKEFLAETDEALNHLYDLFQVKPVAKRIVHDSVSFIEVKSVTWRKQFEELWQMLIPSSGHAPTVQGEVIRIIGKVSNEILDNGACNWCKEYKKLSQALPGYFAMGNALTEQDYKEVEKLAKSISANSDDDLFCRLSQLAVRWVLLNPIPIALNGVDYKW